MIGAVVAAKCVLQVKHKAANCRHRGVSIILGISCWARCSIAFRAMALRSQQLCVSQRYYYSRIHHYGIIRLYQSFNPYLNSYVHYFEIYVILLRIDQKFLTGNITLTLSYLFLG